MSLEPHYTTKQVAELLNVHPDTILRLAQKGHIRSTYIGRERRYPESAVRQYLDRNATKATPIHANVVPLAERRRT